MFKIPVEEDEDFINLLEIITQKEKEKLKKIKPAETGFNSIDIFDKNIILQLISFLNYHKIDTVLVDIVGDYIVKNYKDATAENISASAMIDSSSLSSIGIIPYDCVGIYSENERSDTMRFNIKDGNVLYIYKLDGDLMLKMSGEFDKNNYYFSNDEIIPVTDVMRIKGKKIREMPKEIKDKIMKKNSRYYVPDPRCEEFDYIPNFVLLHRNINFIDFLSLKPKKEMFLRLSRERETTTKYLSTDDFMLGKYIYKSTELDLKLFNDFSNYVNLTLKFKPKRYLIIRYTDKHTFVLPPKMCMIYICKENHLLVNDQKLNHKDLIRINSKTTVNIDYYCKIKSYLILFD